MILTLILFFFIIYCVLVSFNSNFLYLQIFFFTFLYSFEITNYFLNNLNFNILNSFILNFNTFLLNNINKYHPFIFYLSVIFLFLFFLNFFNTHYLINFFFSKESFFSWQIYYGYMIFIFNIFALFLGSWWAMQEGSWGGWWNWDASETLGLLILFFSLILLHYSYKYSYYFNYFYIFLIFLFFIIFIYYFIQLNFDLVSHNFGIKFFYFFNNNLFLLECIIFFYYFWFFFH